MTMCKLKIQPDNKSIKHEKGINLLEAITKAGIKVASPCGGEGTCGKCRVVLKSEGGLSLLTNSEKSFFTDKQIKAGNRLACQAKLVGDATLNIPDGSRISDLRILLSGAVRTVPLNPNIRKSYVQLPKQDLEDAVSAYEQLKSKLDRQSSHKPNITVLRSLGAKLHDSEGKLTAVCRNGKIMAVEAEDTTESLYGIAFDIGTTTIVGVLVDLITGEDLAVASASNPQAQHGHDVISRINFTVEHQDGLETLQNSVLESVNQIIDDLVKSAEISPDKIYEMTVVGNSTMYHLFLGLSPRSLGIMPYIPIVSDAVEVKASDAGIQINPNGNIYVLPNIAGFIGADTVGAILAANFDQKDDKVKMLADIGTNCEIVLRIGDELVACSTPAGPAFEGAKIKHGVYAGPGAIEKIILNEDCEYSVIGNRKPIGICGSGLVDIGAELLRTGIVDQRGKMLSADEITGEISPLIKQRIIKGEDGVEFIVAQASRSSVERDALPAVDHLGDEGNITIAQEDIRELQLAKAAIRTGIDVLIDRVGIELEQLDELLIAGGFGSYINKENAIRLGLIPDLPAEKIKFIGNAAIVGARLALISSEARASADQIPKITQHIQVANTPDFQTQFMEAMLFV